MGNAFPVVKFAAAALLLAPLLTHAAGLGRLAVTSALGEALKAEIEIVSLLPGEEESLSGRLASPEAFRQAGITLNPALIGAQFQVVKRDGRQFLLLSTTQPVNEPFLDVLVELQWATGRLVREYTFLLDPPEYKGPRPIVAAPAPKPAPAAVAAPAPQPAPVARVEPRPVAAPASALKPAGAYEIKKGDTLGKIARDNLPQGVTLQQMLIALYKSNPDAFIRDNVNLIRTGRILNLPDRESAAAIDLADANRLMQAHAADFADYQRKIGAAVAAAPAAPAAGQRTVTGRIAPKPAEPGARDRKDELKLSKSDPAKPTAPGARAARGDDRVASDRSVKDAQSRVAELEKNVTDLQKLLEMKNQTLAALEKKAEATPPSAPAASKAPEAAKPAPSDAAKPAPSEVPAKAQDPAKAPAGTPPEAAKPAAPQESKAAVPAWAKEAAPPAKPKPAPPPPPPPSMVDELLGNPLLPIGVGGALVLLGGLGFYAWRRKKSSQSKFEDSVLATGAAASVFGPAAGAAAADESIASSSVTGASVAPAAESDEVDPIAEADVYMAYGRDAQAEEILREALSKDAKRPAVHAKLAEIYAGRRDTKAFEQTASKLKAVTGGEGAEWQKVVALGATIDPENPLYGGSGGGATALSHEATQTMPASGGAAPEIDFDIGGGASAPEPEMQEPAAPEAETQAAVPDTTGALDFDLGGGTPSGKEDESDFSPSGTVILDSKAAQEAAAASGGLDFDLGGSDEPAAAPESPKAADSGSIDFELNLDMDDAKPAPESAGDAQANVDLSTISFDLDTPGEATPAASGGDSNASADPKWQEVATKLDLAKAYEEMGDKDGARDLLNEVLKEGDAAQQEQASTMLASLA